MTVEQDGDDGLVVTFSDGTSSGFVVEELLRLRPKREPTEPKDPSDAPHRPSLAHHFAAHRTEVARNGIHDVNWNR
jgi:hypothetical protein